MKNSANASMKMKKVCHGDEIQARVESYDKENTSYDIRVR